MRAERIIQASIFDMFAGHEIGRELKAMSEWLDGHPTLVGLVANDLRRAGVRETGRRGLPTESVLRCGLLKQHRQLSYEELAFHLENSSSFRAFARLPLSWTPKKSVLHKTISAIRPETWEAINRTVLASAREEGLDPTVVSPAAISEKPADSWLSRSKDTIEAGTFDISPAETGASLGASARNAVTRGPSLLTKWVFCKKSGSPLA